MDGASWPGDPAKLFEDELVGLDPDDPEAMAFAEHLHRMRQVAPSYTVEGQLRDVGRFVESANRATGHRRMTAVLLVGLILLGVAYVVVTALGEMLSTFS